MKYSMNLMTANPFSPSPGTTATAQFQKQPLLQTSLSGLKQWVGPSARRSRRRGNAGLDDQNPDGIFPNLALRFRCRRRGQ